MVAKSIQQLDSQIVKCNKCPRLVSWRKEVAQTKRKSYQDEKYWGKPVPGFGDENPTTLILGLAPGAHGANRTGRIFTGDSSGDWLYESLFFLNVITFKIYKRNLIALSIFVHCSVFIIKLTGLWNLR